MKLYDRYILILTVTLLGTTGLFTLAGQGNLDVYYAAYIVEYLGVTLLFAALRPKARRVLDLAGYVFSAGLVLIIVQKVLTSIVRGQFL